MKKEYTRDELTVVWQPELCIHSGVCFHALPDVFRPRDRPWIQMDAASKEKIAETVRKCPSGALSLQEQPVAAGITEPPVDLHWHQITVLTNGPLRIAHACRVHLPNGEVVEKPSGVSLCRCGASAKKPFCDGSHKTNGFTG